MYAIQQRRVVVAQPEQRRSHEAGRGQRPGDGCIAARAEHPHQLDTFGGAALVGPHNRRVDRLVFRVEHDRAVHLPAQPDGAHVALTALGDHPAHHRYRRLPPVVRVLLGAVGRGLVDRVFLLGDGFDFARLAVEQDRLDARCPDVDTQQQRHDHLRSTASRAPADDCPHAPRSGQAIHAVHSTLLLASARRSG
ncbi:MAG: hypothetical protein U0521_21365 [Anaerolineae bacterium]